MDNNSIFAQRLKETRTEEKYDPERFSRKNRRSLLPQFQHTKTLTTIKEKVQRFEIAIEIAKRLGVSLDWLSGGQMKTKFER